MIKALTSGFMVGVFSLGVDLDPGASKIALLKGH